MRGRGFVLIFSIAAVLTVATDAPAGGIDDQPCPNVAGENTNTCPPGTVGTPYVIRFVEREGSGCGRGLQTFHLDSGTAPPGLTLDTGGTLSGTPLQAGPFRFYVEMREPRNDPATCAGKETQKQFTLVIRKPVSIASAQPPPLHAEVGAPFRAALRATGGTGVFTWALVDGTLPEGVRLGRSGWIVGTPRTAGAFAFAVRATDTEKRSVSWAGTLRVAGRLVIRTERLRAARVGRFYLADLTSAGGVGPNAWRLESGRLPRGTRLATASGDIRGTPTKPGTYSFTVAVRDALDVRTTSAFMIVVRPAHSSGAARGGRRTAIVR